MLTEQNVIDVLAMYREGYSRKEIKDEYCGINPRFIDEICDEEDEAWSISSKIIFTNWDA